MPDHITRRFHYRIAGFLHGTLQLEALLRQALAAHPLAKDRMYSAGEKEPRIVLNRTLPLDGLLGCELCQYNRDSSHVLIDEDEAAKEFPLASLAPPGQKSRFSESFAYIGVSGNNVVLCSSPVLRSQTVENFLNWFIKDHFGTGTEANAVALKLPIKGVLGEDQLKHVNKIVLDRAIACGFEPDTEKEGKFVMQGGDTNGLQGVMGFMGLAPRAAYRVSGPHQMRASFTLSIPGGAKEAGLVLEQMAHDLRHLADLRYEIHLPHKKLGPKNFNVTDVKSIASDGKIPLTNDLFQKMNKWLQQLAGEGIVPLD